jgi:hypothetical protein
VTAELEQAVLAAIDDERIVEDLDCARAYALLAVRRCAVDEE